jgi:very-short-patch-repair endonuclease
VPPPFQPKAEMALLRKEGKLCGEVRSRELLRLKHARVPTTHPSPLPQVDPPSRAATARGSRHAFPTKLSILHHIFYPVMPHPYIHNRVELKNFRKFLRNNCTQAESILWNYIKGRQLDGRKFRRQHSVGSYILDFYCPEEKLAIELDGAHHFTPEGMARDEKRTQYLNTLNINVLRFENDLILRHTSFVLSEIKKYFAPKSPCLRGTRPVAQRRRGGPHTPSSAPPK